MDNMNITAAQYTVDFDGNHDVIQATIDGIEMFVPLALDNRHYAEILRQVDAGTLVIADAAIPEPADAPEAVDPLDEAMKRITKLEAALKKMSK